MGNGARVGHGLQFATNSYSYSDCLILANTLINKYGLRTSVQSTSVPNQYVIYVFKESMPVLREIVRPYIVPTMLYKLGE